MQHSDLAQDPSELHQSVAAEEDRTTTRDGDHHPYRVPSPRNLASSTSTGHDWLDLVFGALLRFAA